MPEQEMKRAVIYARVASATKGDQAAIDRQLRKCRQAARALHAAPEHEFVDHGISGLTLNRVGLGQLLAYAAASPVDYVICADAARLSRDPELYSYLAERLSIYGAQIIVADSGIATGAAAPDGQNSH
jgi:DNA invertase Pin-like site-specific DNA recombinase